MGAWAEIQPFYHPESLDVDGNGAVDPKTEGLVILRAMFGLSGTAVTGGAVTPGVPRDNWTAIRACLIATCGTSFAP